MNRIAYLVFIKSILIFCSADDDFEWYDSCDDDWPYCPQLVEEVKSILIFLCGQNMFMKFLQVVTEVISLKVVISANCLIVVKKGNAESLVFLTLKTF